MIEQAIDLFLFGVKAAIGGSIIMLGVFAIMIPVLIIGSYIYGKI